MIQKLIEEKGHLSIGALTLNELVEVLNTYTKGIPSSNEEAVLVKSPDEKWVDLDELQKELDVSRSTIYRLRQKAIFPEYQIGGKVKFKLNEVKNALRVNPIIKSSSLK